MQSLAATVQTIDNAQRRETEGVRSDVRALGQRVDLHIATGAVQRAVATPPDPL